MESYIIFLNNVIYDQMLYLMCLNNIISATNET